MSKGFARKAALAYLCAGVLCIVITNVYALFGHGIRSDAMDFMFLYPTVGGGGFLGLCLLLKRGEAASGFRFGFNAYNSGLAALTAGALLQGIVEIAGTGSGLIKYFFIAGCALCATGSAALYRPGGVK
ncbi:MAG: hypothetical protein LBR44_03085 [Clostridiales Family XIII bacterium]|jgi:hypothetical protein|nr:hypothetical protein [Clostridiales Family XIII bacterium]